MNITFEKESWRWGWERAGRQGSGGLRLCIPGTCKFDDVYQYTEH